MKNTTLKALCGVMIALAGLAIASAADRVELKDGSVIVGKLLSEEGGKFKVETAFIGTIEIPQDKVKSFSTEDPVNVAIAGANPVLGRVDAAEDGIKIAMNNSPVTIATGKVTAVWRKDSDSPEVRKLKALAADRVLHWAFEASAAIAGRTGVADKFGADLGFKATLANSTDKLVLTYAFQRATDNGVETANRQFAGADYSSFFSSPENGWYARTSLEQDRIKLLDLRSNSSAGFGHKLIKNKQEDLEARVGVNYVYEKYSNDTGFESPGLDVAILHSYQFKNAKLTNALAYMPAFKDFSNYRLHHESAFEIPLAASLWKLKFGVANDYNSVPPDDVKRLDTTYFTSLLLNWK
jgi:putative salt-induced outer membrane protein YdiY